MKRVVRVVAGVAVAACMMMTAGNAMADQAGPKFKLGVGTYNMIIGGDSASIYSDDHEDAEFKGGALVGTACFTRHVAVRGALYATENKDISEWEANGGDLQLLFGTNFYEGFNVFGGFGVFSETWKISQDLGPVTGSIEKDFSGGQLSCGVGYSWSKVALDFMMNFRDTSDYEDFTKVDHDFAVTGGITLSYIF